MDSNTDMMKVFESQEFGTVRLAWEADRILFSATDSARALGYANPYAAVKRHCRAPLTKREVVTQSVNQFGAVSEQAVEMSFISEGDLYRLIVHSKLPSAERFERWVFDEVLPSIRKHGAYMTDSVLEQVIENPDTIYSLAEQLLEDKVRCEELTRQLKDARPKAEYFDSFIRADGCICIRYCGKEFGIPQNTFVKLMLEHKYLYRDQKNRLMPFADKQARGFFIVRDFYTPNGVLGQQTLVTCKGKEHIRRQLKKWGIIA